MKKILLLLFISITVQAQYVIEPAFPNLGRNFQIPMELISSKDGTNRLFLLERNGKVSVWKNRPDAIASTFIDLRPIINQEALGMAFHPNYRENGYFYLSYCYDTIVNNNTVIEYIWRVSRFTVSSNPNVALLSTRLNIFGFREPQAYHNGGKLEFEDSTGYLCMSTGDGGIGGWLAGDKTSYNGKILRIDVNNSTATTNYTIPTSNPFYNNINGWKKEIYASGFRNPWKFSFDKGHLIVADVQEELWEEIDEVKSGRDYGWNQMEGTYCFNACDTVGKNYARPIYQYPHLGTMGCVIGGWTYRGHQRPELYGDYLFANYNGISDNNSDISIPDIFSGIRNNNRSIPAIFSLGYDYINSPIDSILIETDLSVTNFGRTENNEILFCDIFTGVYRFYPYFQWGDINTDNVIDLKDLTICYNASTGFMRGYSTSDLNFDNRVDLDDLLIVWNNLN